MLQNISKKPKATCTSTQCTWRRGTPARTGGGSGAHLEEQRRTWRKITADERGRTHNRRRPSSMSSKARFSYDQGTSKWGGEGSRSHPGRLRRSEGFEGPSSSFTKRLQG